MLLLWEGAFGILHFFDGLGRGKSSLGRDESWLRGFFKFHWGCKSLRDLNGLRLPLNSLRKILHLQREFLGRRLRKPALNRHLRLLHINHRLLGLFISEVNRFLHLTGRVFNGRLLHLFINHILDLLLSKI